MALVVSSIVPQTLGAEGGELLEITANFADFPGTRYRVFIGPTGTVSDSLCVSGISGVPSLCVPTPTNVLRCYTSVLEPSGGSPYSVLVMSEDSLISDLVADALTVLPRQFQTKVFDMRRILHRSFFVGPRSMDALEPAE